MATYSELHGLSTDATLLDRIAVAVAVAAQAINDEPAETPYHDRRKRWAAQALREPDSTARQMIWALLAQNKDATVETIQGATDGAIQAAVNNTIELFIEQ